MKNVLAVLAVIGAVIFAVVITVGVWQFNWFVTEKNTDRQVQIDNRQKGTQTAWRDEARNAITDYELIDPANTAARGALRVKACSLIDRLVPTYLDNDLAQFQTQECN